MKVPVKFIQKPTIAIPVQSEFIRLDAFLKLANAVESGGQAKVAIQEGKVRVNGEACLLRGKKLRPGDIVRCAGENYQVTAGEA
jgi:ribosome-associated protein